MLIDGLLSSHDDYARFHEYFTKYYAESTGSLWATFGRIGSHVTTNMHIESYHRLILITQSSLILLFHRVLKKKFLNRQANRRVDVLVNILIHDVAPYYEYIEDRRVRGKLLKLRIEFLR